MPETIFDRVAERYDEARPGYPDALVADVTRIAGLGPEARILELGSGTGKATLPFARLGHRLTCVEPGPGVRAVAERKLAGHAVRFRACSFEDWPLEPEAYELVLCAQAWHWLDPALRAPKAAAALQPGGSLALFWNRPGERDPDAVAALDAAYRQHAPELANESVRGGVGCVPPGVVDELLANGRFELVAERRYPWSWSHDADGYLALLGTHSDHLKLSEARRAALHRAVAAAIEGLGGRLESRQEAWLLVARRS